MPINELNNLPQNCITTANYATYKIRSTNAEVDDVSDSLARVTFPLSAADAFREASHLLQDAIYIWHHLSHHPTYLQSTVLRGSIH